MNETRYRNIFTLILCSAKYSVLKAITKPLPSLVRYPLWMFAAGNVVCLYLFLGEPDFGSVGRIYNFNTIVMPIALLLMSFTGFLIWKHWTKKSEHFKGTLTCLIISLILICIRTWATTIEPHMLKIRRVSIESSKISEPLRILHVSDIQTSVVGMYEELIFTRINELQPDLVLFTGDLLQPQFPATIKTELPQMRSLVETIKAPIGVYGVFGDVDYRILHLTREELGGITMLRDEEAIIELKGATVRLFGLTCPLSKAENVAPDSINDWLSKTNPNDLTIVMGHAPDYAMNLQNTPIDICLAGHTHGGQVRIPFLGPIITLSDVPHSWARGFRTIGKTKLNVSAGAGSERADNVPKIRFSCPTEMTLIEFVPKDNT